MSDVPQTIDDIRINVEFGGLPPTQGDVYEFPLTSTAKSQLRAIIEAEIAQIIGEEERMSGNMQADILSRYVNSRITKQRQRAAEAMDRLFNRGESYDK